ncbi:MAG: hypothetical protein EP330_09985 [Deltaproteobacteria bacterium]|nr:MAG: hypothetical protein EP330_09985 [Deltaproteobacteria bacterium]
MAGYASEHGGFLNPHVDGYITRETRWKDETIALREVLLGEGLDEDYKWGKPCYASGGTNIAIIQSMSDFLSLMFFKGILLADPQGLLEEQGENTHAARRVCFRSAEDVAAYSDAVKALIKAAIVVEEMGTPLPPRPKTVLCDELQDALDADPALARAFDELTPGRQREYNLYISGAKQSATRARRVEKYAPQILAGKGMRE